MQSEIVTLLLGGFGAVLLGIALLVASTLIGGPRQPSRDDTLLTTLSVAGWVLIAVGVFGCICSLLSLLAIVPGVIAAIVIAEILVKRRASRQYALLGMMAVAVERSLPLVEVVAAFARERRGLFASRARRLSRLLAGGVCLPDALGRIPGLVPVEARPIIDVGHQSGGLAGALRRASAARDARNECWFSLAGRMLYLCMLAGFGIGVFMFAMLRVVPAYSRILKDFNADMPAPTSLLVDVSSLLSEHEVLLWLISAAALLLLTDVILRYVGWVRYELPGYGLILRRLDAAVILDALALASQHQSPLEETFAVLARSYHKASIRRRLRGVLRDLQSGADWLDSLLRRGLIKQADLGVLRAAQRVGNLPWALGEMADSNRRRLAYRLYAVLQVCFPMVVLALGAMVAFVVTALFLPLIALIEKAGCP